MADFYCDQGGYPDFVEPPAWGVAYDGDGQGSNVASVATASIDFTGVTASANSLGVMGVVLTVTGASSAALASAVVAAINASTTAVSAGTSYTRPQLRDLVFARVNPGNSSGVQLMTRAGGVQLNHAVNSNVAITTAGMTGAPVITQFDGSTSGAWSQFITKITVLPSAKTKTNYGIGFNNLSASGSLLCSPRKLTTSDMVWVRARNQIIYTSESGGTFYSPMRMVIDANNEIWPDTLGKKFYCGCGPIEQQQPSYAVMPGTGESVIDFKLAANARGACIVYVKNNNTGNYRQFTIASYSGNGGYYDYENVMFHDDSLGSGGTGMRPIVKHWQSGGHTLHRFSNCDFRWSRTGSFSTLNGFDGTTYNTMDISFQGCKFIFDALSGVHPGLIEGHDNIDWMQVTFKDCICQSAGIVPPTKVLPTRSTLRAVNLQGFTPGALGLFGNFPNAIDGSFSVQQIVGQKKQTRIESSCALIEWVPAGGFPTYRAFMEDGTYWAWRLTWSNAPRLFYGDMPADQVILTKRSPATDAVRTVTLEILVPPEAAGVHNRQIGMTLGYVGADGVLYSQTTQPAMSWRKTPTALAESTAPWVMNAYSSYLKRKLTLTTQNAVKGDVDMVATVQFLNVAPNASSFVFVDPEIEIA